jgi:NTP pyrophosphatase (non-canonical NTP hydrolase)
LTEEEWKAYQTEREENLTIERLMHESHRIAVDHGWWDGERPIPELLMLIVTEAAEAMEAYRASTNVVQLSDKIQGFDGMEEELADIMIRVADMAKANGYRLSEAIVAKLKYNESRPYRHGGKRA